VRNDVVGKQPLQRVGGSPGDGGEQQVGGPGLEVAGEPGRGFLADGDDLQAAGKLPLQFLKVRHRFHTRTAVRAPKLQEHYFSPELRQGQAGLWTVQYGGEPKGRGLAAGQQLSTRGGRA
jgi:hypothetical protein